MSVQKKLDALFAADRALHLAEDAFLESAGEKELLLALATATRKALTRGGDTAEIELVRIADLCAQIEAPGTAAILIDILDHEDPAVRAEAGECLLAVAYDRYKEVATAIEGALASNRDGLAMEELPYVLVEVREPDPVPLIARFLKHARAEVVASAIEALVEHGNPSAVPFLQALRDDSRTVTLSEFEDDRATLGALVSDALGFFDELLDEGSEPTPEKPTAARGGRSR